MGNNVLKKWRCKGLYCKKCGTEIKEGAVFCHKCGGKIAEEYVEQQTEGNRKEKGTVLEPDFEGRQEKGDTDQITENVTSFDEDGSDVLEWWNNCSKEKKIFIVLGTLLVGGIAIYALIAFLREFGYLLLGIAVIGGFIITLKTGTMEEKIEMRKTIVQMAAVGVGIVIFV